MEPGESVLMISMVKKLQKLTNKKVQLILTNKPKLIYVDPAKLVVKGNIIWSDNPNDLSIQITSPSNFKICTVSYASSHLTCYFTSYIIYFINTTDLEPRFPMKLKLQQVWNLPFFYICFSSCLLIKTSMPSIYNVFFVYGI